MLNSLTTLPNRNVCESLNIHPNAISDPSITTAWSWNNYFYYLSLNGLHGCLSFQSYFPVGSDGRELYNQYSLYGHQNLDYLIIN